MSLRLEELIEQSGIGPNRRRHRVRGLLIRRQGDDRGQPGRFRRHRLCGHHGLGGERLSRKTGNWVRSSPVVVEGLVIVASGDGTVTAIGEKPTAAP